MRLQVVLSMMSVAALAACAGKSRPTVAEACPPPTGDQLYHATFDSVDAKFGKRHLGYHVLDNSHTTDARGNMIMHLGGIGPASEDQPGPGQGKRLDVVVQRCTGKVLRYYEP